jgi:hypothetical protein
MGLRILSGLADQLRRQGSHKSSAAAAKRQRQLAREQQQQSAPAAATNGVRCPAIGARFHSPPPNSLPIGDVELHLQMTYLPVRLGSALVCSMPICHWCKVHHPYMSLKANHDKAESTLFK